MTRSDAVGMNRYAHITALGSSKSRRISGLETSNSLVHLRASSFGFPPPPKKKDDIIYEQSLSLDQNHTALFQGYLMLPMDEKIFLQLS